MTESGTHVRKAQHHRHPPAMTSLPGCTDKACAQKGTGEFRFGILFYGAPVDFTVLALTFR